MKSTDLCENTFIACDKTNMNNVQLSEKHRAKVPRERVECQSDSGLCRWKAEVVPGGVPGVVAGLGNSLNSVTELRDMCERRVGGFVFGIDKDRWRRSW